MDNIKAENKKKRGNRKKRRPPPLPIFHSDKPTSNEPMPGGASLFPENTSTSTDIVMKQNVIMNKFNELLDWRFPTMPPNAHADFVYRRAYEDTEFDNRRVDDSHDYDYGDLNDRRAYGYADRNFAREKCPVQNPSFNQGKHEQLDSFDLRNRIGHPNKRLRYFQDPDDNLRKDSFDIAQTDIGPDFYDNKETWNQKMTMPTETSPNSKRARLNSSNSDERRAGHPRIYPSADLLSDFDRRVTEYWPDSEQPRKEQSSHPNLELRIDYPNERDFKGNRNVVYGDRMDVDFRGENCVQSDNHSRHLVREAGDMLDIKKRWDRNQYKNWYCDQNLRTSASVPMQNQTNGEQMLAGSSHNHLGDQDLYNPTTMPKKNYSNEEHTSAASFYNRSSDQDPRNPASVSENNNSIKEHVSAGSSQNWSRDDKNKVGKFEETQSINQEHDLIVVIHKQNFARFSHEEADILKSVIIDLVVNCGNSNANEMPEFVSSGLMPNGRAFYLNCRTVETMRWMLHQCLPPLNGLNLYIRKDIRCQVVKISTYAKKCTRTKKEILKLLKLQNGKKGFNFDNWTIKGYDTSPSGVYFSFEVPLEDAQLLKDMGSQLSFELRSLNFKIVMSSVRTVSRHFPGK